MAQDFSALLQLPDEIIQRLAYHLDARSICRVSQTCRRLASVIRTSDAVWQDLYQNRWPTIDTDTQPTPSGKSWRTQFKDRHLLEVALDNELLVQMRQHAFLDVQMVLQVSERRTVALAEAHGDSDFTHTLYKLREASYEFETFQNLHQHYYASRLRPSVVHHKLKAKLAAFSDTGAASANLLQGALLFEEWLTLYDASDICNPIMNTLERLALEHLSRPLAEATSWAKLQTIKTVLFQDFGLGGNMEQYYDTQNSYISSVLLSKRGIPITVSIIFLELARRLNLTAYPMNARQHFVVNVEHDDGRQVCVDCFNEGEERAPSDAEIATPVKVLFRMAMNVLNIFESDPELQPQALSTLDFMATISPTFPVETMRASMRLQTGAALEDLPELLQQIGQRMPALLDMGEERQRLQRMEEHTLQLLEAAKTPRVMTRTDRVLYRVGQVVEHRLYGYEATIRGWDSECRMSQSWILRMGVHRLPNGPNQPFYHVLAADGTQRFAAQENLKLLENPHPVPHAELGRYFTGWNATRGRFELNDALQQGFPDD
eukprot:m.188447 g.188447  ORF g.188447 m.188447 type:complete len:546 (-) comp18186_c0_seq3:205-1842(-)